MADQAKIGKAWSGEELDAIVADYFAMLGAELTGLAYVKSRHSAALMSKIGRTHRSVEFKRQNISAVLDEMGLPWISGYKPKRNYQNAIFGAIERQLALHTDLLSLTPESPPPAEMPAEIFVPPPALGPRAEALPEPLRCLIRKFDPVERDRRNRALGRAGEEFVVRLESRRLCLAGRADLAHKVRWVAAEDGDGAGYDILSFNSEGRQRLLEVKTTNGSARTPFFLSRNERALAEERPEEWRLYRVHLFAISPRVFKLGPPLEASLHLSPEVWRASPQ